MVRHSEYHMELDFVKMNLQDAILKDVGKGSIFENIQLINDEMSERLKARVDLTEPLRKYFFWLTNFCLEKKTGLDLLSHHFNKTKAEMLAEELAKKHIGPIEMAEKIKESEIKQDSLMNEGIDKLAKMIRENREYIQANVQ